VEARPGSSTRPPGRVLIHSSPDDPAGRPDLQIQADRNLGNGNTLVCELGPPPTPLGGVPGINPPSYELTQMISDALNDFGCRFDTHVTTDDACTKDALEDFKFVASNTTLQFCSVPTVALELAFPSGETRLTVQVRDTGGNIGNQRAIIIRVL